MTGRELRQLLEDTELTIEELCEALNEDVRKIRALLQLGDEKVPLQYRHQLRPVVHNYT